MATARSMLVCVLLLLLLASACGAPRITAETQPYHMAIVPFDLSVLPPAEDAREEDLPLRFEGDALARVFGELLDGLSFSRVTVLEPPREVPAAEFAAWPSERREAHWIDAAAACRADLLLQADLRLSPKLERSFVGSSLLAATWDGLLKYAAWATGNVVAVALSASVSISAWDNADRSYRFEVGIDGSLHELAPLLDPASEASLGNRRAELLRLFVYDSDARLSFVERAALWEVPLSFLVPSTLLAGSTRTEHESLREVIAEYLAKVFVQELEFRRGELLRGGDLCPFEVRRLDLREGPGGLSLGGELELATDVIDRMGGYRIWIGDDLVVERAFDPPAARAGAPRGHYAFEAELPRVDPDVPIRLEIRDAAPRQNVRTFTLRAGRTGRRAERPLAFDLPLPR